MKALVVDDEVLTAEYLCRLLRNFEVEVSGYFINPLEALENVNKVNPDVIFLDIEMPEMSGLELAEKATANGYEGELIFITAYNQYAIEAFTVNALDYLLKPVIAEDLSRAIDRVKKRRAVAIHFSANTNKKVKVSLFGKIALYVGEKKKPVRWITVKSAEVFAYMLLQKNNKEVSKWKIIEGIWPDIPREKADINLRSAISRLNKSLRENSTGISLISTGNGYQLSTEGIELEIDVFILEKLALNITKIDSGNADYYHNLILSCNDLLLEEVSHEWCDALRGNFHFHFINAANKLIIFYEKLGAEPLKILNIIEIMIKYEPYDDQIRKKELELRFQLGGKKEAQKFYKNYKNLIKKDLDLEPSNYIKAAYQSIMQE